VSPPKLLPLKLRVARYCYELVNAARDGAINDRALLAEQQAVIQLAFLDARQKLHEEAQACAYAAAQRMRDEGAAEADVRKEVARLLEAGKT
jgi:hypothetical protein